MVNICISIHTAVNLALMLSPCVSSTLGQQTSHPQSSPQPSGRELGRAVSVLQKHKAVVTADLRHLKPTEHCSEVDLVGWQLKCNAFHDRQHQREHADGYVTFFFSWNVTQMGKAGTGMETKPDRWVCSRKNSLPKQSSGNCPSPLQCHSSSSDLPGSKAGSPPTESRLLYHHLLHTTSPVHSSLDCHISQEYCLHVLRVQPQLYQDNFNQRLFTSHLCFV